MSHEHHEAPGRLEDVRTLLNTWRVPNNTRVPEDKFDAYLEEHGGLQTDDERLRRFRDELRRAVEVPEDAAAILNRWLEQIPLRVAVVQSAADLETHYHHESGWTGELLEAAMKAVEAGEWGRLKACPDCRWVFYDHTRNGSKKWCGMYAGGPEGRACGTIAKVRRHRARQEHLH